MENMVGQCLLYIMLLALLAWPLGIYMGKVMDGEPLWLQKELAPCERGNTMTQIYSRPSPDALLAQLQQAAPAAQPLPVGTRRRSSTSTAC